MDGIGLQEEPVFDKAMGTSGFSSGVGGVNLKGDGDLTVAFPASEGHPLNVGQGTIVEEMGFVTDGQGGACTGSQSGVPERQVFAGIGGDNDFDTSAGVGGPALYPKAS
jgi:hypothetical protein